MLNAFNLGNGITYFYNVRAKVVRISTVCHQGTEAPSKPFLLFKIAIRFLLQKGIFLNMEVHPFIFKGIVNVLDPLFAYFIKGQTNDFPFWSVLICLLVSSVL